MEATKVKLRDGREVLLKNVPPEIIKVFLDLEEYALRFEGYTYTENEFFDISLMEIDEVLGVGA
ncbi:MAG: hypothetical protein AAB651_00250 [Patescibacteria group bacterium]